MNNTILSIKEQMRVKEQAMNTALIVAESNNKSDYELFDIQMMFEAELVELQKELDKLMNVKQGNASEEYILRFARNN